MRKGGNEIVFIDGVYVGFWKLRKGEGAVGLLFV